MLNQRQCHCFGSGGISPDGQRLETLKAQFSLDYLQGTCFVRYYSDFCEPTLQISEELLPVAVYMGMEGVTEGNELGL